MLPAVYKTVVHADIIIASKITQHNSPVSYWQLDFYGHGGSRTAVYRVAPTCSCYRCADLSCGRDSGAADYAIELRG